MFGIVFSFCRAIFSAYLSHCIGHDSPLFQTLRHHPADPRHAEDGLERRVDDVPVGPVEADQVGNLAGVDGGIL